MTKPIEKCLTCNTENNLCDKCPDFEWYPDLDKDTRFCNEHCICPDYPNVDQLAYIISYGLDY